MLKPGMLVKLDTKYHSRYFAYSVRRDIYLEIVPDMIGMYIERKCNTYFTYSSATHPVSYREYDVILINDILFEVEQGVMVKHVEETE